MFSASAARCRSPSRRARRSRTRLVISGRTLSAVGFPCHLILMPRTSISTTLPPSRSPSALPSAPRRLPRVFCAAQRCACIHWAGQNRPTGGKSAHQTIGRQTDEPPRHWHRRRSRRRLSGQRRAKLDKVTVQVVIVARCRCFLHIGDKPTQASQFGQQFRLGLSCIACSHAYDRFVQYAPLMLINMR